ncbi:general stress protein [Galactobacter sp.]|uniref:general stress protein n=1 Tax=Galactobacter sp. TaxID=2676125 RepID=UPI0025BC168C|nr:general stress protein [Galactobacter sp.]
MSTPRPEQARMFPTIPRGEVIGRYEDYLDAQKIVDYLADNDFPVANVSIIGNDLKLVERVKTKLSYPRVALQGASQGAMIGLFFGFLLMLFSPTDEASGLSLIAAVLMGAVLFMLMSVISYAMQKGKRDFSSSRQVLPSTWDVVVDRSVAGQARQLASRLPMRPAQAASTSGWGAPVQTPPQAEPGQQPGTGRPGAGQQGGEPAGTPATGQAVDQPSVPSADFRDLADGRPRYGVRVEQPEQPEQPGRATPEAAPRQESAPKVGGEFLPSTVGEDTSKDPSATEATAGEGEPGAEAGPTSSGTESTPDEDQEREQR